jgi:hopanoid C-3 methylase
MKVLLIRPRPDSESIGLQSFMICEPLELEYAAAHLEQHGHQVTILDMLLEHGPLTGFLRAHEPDVVGLTGYINHVGVIRDYARTVKRFDDRCWVVVGGVHAEVEPEVFEDEHIDFVLHVNALASMRALLEQLDGGRDHVRRAVPGVWDGPAKPYALCTSFDYPFPDRSKTLRYRRRYNYIFHEKCATLKTSFGCTFACDFCFCPQITRGHYFERDIADVVRELESIVEQNVFIVDDNFLYNARRVELFCRLIQERGIRKKYILFGRADFIVHHEGLIRRLRDVGLHAVFVGVESMRQEDLEALNKKMRVATNEEAIRILERHSIECYCGIVVGPDWSEEDFEGLTKWLNQFEHPLVNIQPVTPLPRTPLGERMRDVVRVPREAHARYDMAHLLWQPERLSVRRYYWLILRTYYLTMVGLRGHLYILRRYGFARYIRVARGIVHITLQYLVLCAKGRL